MPDPLYSTWDEYLAATTEAQRLEWCRRKAKKANQPRLMSGAPDVRLTAAQVLRILIDAEGRCAHCHSLAVEPRPSNEKGHPVAWDSVGRRIGSLDHSDSRVAGGSNEPDNLRWSCLWCNTWPNQRVPGAEDHGGIQDGSLPPAQAPRPQITAGEVAAVVAAVERQRSGASESPAETPRPYDPFNADHWAEVTDPDDPDYLRGTAMSRD